MPIFKIVGDKWPAASKIIQSIEDDKGLRTVLPQISKKLNVPSVSKYYTFWKTDGPALNKVCVLSLTTPLKDQGCKQNDYLYVAPKKADDPVSPYEKGEGEHEECPSSTPASLVAEPPSTVVTTEKAEEVKDKQPMTSDASPKPAGSANKDYRARVMAMYQKYQPDKLAGVDSLMAKVAAGEEDLPIQKLVEKRVTNRP